MIKKVGNLRIIGTEVEHENCEYCGKKDELRPYGRGGAMICYDCGMKPENRAITDKKVKKALS